MSKFFFLVIAFTIVTCVQKEHNVQEREWNIKEGFIPDEDTAIKVAEVIWCRIYGEDIKEKKPFKARLIDAKVWLIEGSLPEGYIGGVPYAKIQKNDGKILEIYHSK